MKFEYGEKSGERECVAVIAHGHLYVKTEEGCTAFPSDAAFSQDVKCGEDDLWDESVIEATHKFYPGDKITITF